MYNLYAPIQHLRRVQPAPGGLCLTAFAKWEDVQTWPTANPETGVLETPILLRPGATWYRLNAIDKGRVLSEIDKEDHNGPFIETTVTGELSGDNINILLSIQAMRFHQYVLLVKDRSGVHRLIGDRQAGADFRYDYNSGDSSSNRRRTVQFVWQSPDPAPIYLAPDTIVIDDAEYTLPVAVQGDFGDDFNDDFFNHD